MYGNCCAAAGRAAGGCGYVCVSVPVPRCKPGAEDPPAESSGTAVWLGTQPVYGSGGVWLSCFQRAEGRCSGAGRRHQSIWDGAPQGRFTRALARLTKRKQVPKLAGGHLEQGAGAGEGCSQSGRQAPSSLCQWVGWLGPCPPGGVPELPDGQVWRQRWRCAPRRPGEPWGWVAAGKTACSIPACSWQGLNGRGN